MVAFIDSNVLIYATTDDPRRVVALETLAKPFVISVQSLNETTHVLRRKLKSTWSVVDDAIALLSHSADRIDAISVETRAEARRIA